VESHAGNAFRFSIGCPRKSGRLALLTYNADGPGDADVGQPPFLGEFGRIVQRTHMREHPVLHPGDEHTGNSKPSRWQSHQRDHAAVFSGISSVSATSDTLSRRPPAPRCPAHPRRRGCLETRPARRLRCIQSPIRAELCATLTSSLSCPAGQLLRSVEIPAPAVSAALQHRLDQVAEVVIDGPAARRAARRSRDRLLRRLFSIGTLPSAAACSATAKLEPVLGVDRQTSLRAIADATARGVQDAPHAHRVAGVVQTRSTRRCRESPCARKSALPQQTLYGIRPG